MEPLNDVIPVDPITLALGALWLLSEALASIPAVKANSVFQLVAGLLARFKRPLVGVALVGMAMGIQGCGKTLDQLRSAAHAVIDIGAKVYEDVKDDAQTVKDALKGEPKPTVADK